MTGESWQHDVGPPSEAKYLVSVRSAESDPSRVLDILTNQGVATRVLQGFLDVGGLVANHIDHQLGSSQLSQFLVCWFYLWWDHKKGAFWEISVRVFCFVIQTIQKHSAELLSFFACTYLEVVKRKKGLRLSSLLLNVLNTVSASLFRVNNDGVHVFAQHFGDSNLIFLLGGLTQVDQAAILEKEECHMLLLMWASHKLMWHIGLVSSPQSRGTVA